ncbi:MAG: hypothetical protein MUD03_08495 [Pirellula sp.]|nr:hypothetical protein [Pirellula sp.]
MKMFQITSVVLVVVVSMFNAAQARSESIADRIKRIDSPLAAKVLKDLQKIEIGMYNGRGKATVRETGEDNNDPSLDHDRTKLIAFFGNVDPVKLEGFFREDIEESGKTTFEVSTPNGSFTAVKADGQIKLGRENEFTRSVNVIDNFSQLLTTPISAHLQRENKEIVFVSFQQPSAASENVILKAEVIAPNKSRFELEVEFANVSGFTPTRYRYVQDGMIVIGKLEYEKRGDAVVPMKATIERKSQSGKYITVIDVHEYEIGAAPAERFTKEAIGL